jgi:hypothetical protein
LNAFRQLPTATQNTLLQLIENGLLGVVTQADPLPSPPSKH